MASSFVTIDCSPRDIERPPGSLATAPPPPKQPGGKNHPLSYYALWPVGGARKLGHLHSTLPAWPRIRGARMTLLLIGHTHGTKEGGGGAPLLPAPATRGSYLSPIFAIQLILHSALTGGHSRISPGSTLLVCYLDLAQFTKPARDTGSNYWAHWEPSSQSWP